MLSCDCGYDDYEWYYIMKNDEYQAAEKFKCYGCGEDQPAGTVCRDLECYGEPEKLETGEVAEDDYDPMDYHTSTLQVCEKCGDLYDSLYELGFCLTAEMGFIKEAHQQYKEDYVAHLPKTD